MEPVQVTVKELRSGLSRYLRMAKTGRSVVITERGKPIGRIVPPERATDSRLAEMVADGQVLWNGRKLAALTPPARVAKGHSIAALVIGNRE